MFTVSDKFIEVNIREDKFKGPFRILVRKDNSDFGINDYVSHAI